MRCFSLLLLWAPPHVFSLLETQPREQTKNRLVKVLSWFAVPDAQQYLKRTGLGFQVIGLVMALASARNKPGEVPVLVRLAQGQAHDLIRRQATAVLGNLHRDPGLDHGAATSVLVSTGINLSVRFDDYLLHPFKTSLMVEVWDAGFGEHIMTLLGTPEEHLDMFGLQLQEKAKMSGDGVAYLKSPSVQRALRGVWEASGANTLDAERKHVSVKRNETSHVTHVAVASRNVILRDLERERSGYAYDFIMISSSRL